MLDPFECDRLQLSRKACSIQRRNPERPKPTEPPASVLDFFTGSIRIDRVSKLRYTLGQHLRQALTRLIQPATRAYRLRFNDA